MARPKNPNKEPFRPNQVVSPVPSERRFGRPRKDPNRAFDVHVSNIANGQHVLTVPTRAPTQQEAIATVKKRLWNSPLVRHITDIAFSATEAKD